MSAADRRVVVTGLAVACGLVLALVGCFRVGAYGLAMAAGAAVIAARSQRPCRQRTAAAAVRGAERAAQWTAGGACSCWRASRRWPVGPSRRWLRASPHWDGPAGGCGVRRAGGVARGQGAPASPASVDRSRPRCPSAETLRVIQGRCPSSRPLTLGREWLLTTAELARGLEPDMHESILRRRSEALDELERRDPAGFSRWLADGSCPGQRPRRVRACPVAGRLNRLLPRLGDAGRLTRHRSGRRPPDAGARRGLPPAGGSRHPSRGADSRLPGLPLAAMWPPRARATLSLYREPTRQRRGHHVRHDAVLPPPRPHLDRPLPRLHGLEPGRGSHPPRRVRGRRARLDPGSAPAARRRDTAAARRARRRPEDPPSRPSAQAAGLRPPSRPQGTS